MEIRVKIRATQQELSEVFKFDEVLNIRYYEKIDGENLYKAIIRIPECDIRETNHLVTLKNLKQKVVEACEDEFPIQSMVLFTNGASRTIYASTLAKWCSRWCSNTVLPEQYMQVHHTGKQNTQKYMQSILKQALCTWND